MGVVPIFSHDVEQKQLRAIDSMFVAIESLKARDADFDEYNIHNLCVSFLRQVKFIIMMFHSLII